jgi:thiamine biosynthesis lipoprotein
MTPSKINPASKISNAINSFDFTAMGSPCNIRIYAADPATAASAISAAVAEVQRLEIKFSRYKKDNLLHQVNCAAQVAGSCEVDEEFISMLNYAHTCYEQSDGLFDITSGVLRKIWDFKANKIPTAQEIENTLRSVGWQFVSWRENTIDFAQPGMEIDFGGLVKEYAVDCAANVLRKQGIHHGIVDLGGDLHIIGSHPSGDPWVINIRHPRKVNTVLATFELRQGALASSGDYERFIDIDGKRYCHILSPQTGWPVSGLAAVTVVADQCIIAGSMCTIAMLKELAGPSWLAEIN